MLIRHDGDLSAFYVFLPGGGCRWKAMELRVWRVAGVLGQARLRPYWALIAVIAPWATGRLSWQLVAGAGHNHQVSSYGPAISAY